MNKRVFAVFLCAMLAAIAPLASAIEWNFNTDGDTEGWAADNDIASVEASGGSLVATAEAYTGGGAPTVAATGLSINADTDHYLLVDVERPYDAGAPIFNSVGNYKDMKLYFDNGNGWSETDAKYLISHATNQGQHTAIFDLKTVAGGGGSWSGTVTGIRLGLITWDATDKMSGKVFRINRIAITSTPGQYFWDFNENAPEGWCLSGGTTVNFADGQMVLSGVGNLVYFTQFNWWTTGRMYFNADRDHYLRMDVSAISPDSDPKWLGFWVWDNGMSVNYPTGITVVPNTGMKSYFLDLSTALPGVWNNANDIEGSLCIDTSNWANFASDTVKIDYISITDGSGDADGDGISDVDEMRDLDPSTPGVQNPFNPSEADTTGDNGAVGPDGTPDGQNDFDGDGYANGAELNIGTNPLVVDEPPVEGDLPLAGAAGLALLAAALGTAAYRKMKNK